MKKILYSFYLIVFLQVAHAASVDDLIYQVINDEVIITDCDTSAEGALEIPSEIDGKTVTSIGNQAFHNCSSLTSISIPDSITSIGLGTFFSCDSLTSINIPGGVTSFGDFVFYHCSSLTSVNIPDGVTNIGSYAFFGCSSLTSVNIPDGVTSIGNSAFSSCHSLISISIPDGVTSIGSSVFFSCSSLRSVHFLGEAPSVEASAFSGTANGRKAYVSPTHLATFGNEGDDWNGLILTLLPPDTPTNVWASKGWKKGEIILGWAPVVGATEYKIYVSHTGDAPYTLIGTSSTNSFSDLLASAGTTNYYKISAINSAGASLHSISENAYGYMPEEIPSAPAMITASQATYSNKINISWSAVDGAQQYHVYISEDDTSPYTQIATTTETSLDYKSVAGAPQQYYFRIRAANDAGLSPYTDAAIGSRSGSTPAAPANFEATDGTKIWKVDLTWDAVDDADEYVIYRSETGAWPYTQLATSKSTSYPDWNTSGGIHYYYTIRAKRGNALSAYSDADIGSRSDVVPHAPVNVTASRWTYKDKIELSWDTVENATEYQIYVSETDSWPYTLHATISDNSFEVREAANGKAYFFKVRAYNENGWSPYSVSEKGIKGNY